MIVFLMVLVGVFNLFLSSYYPTDSNKAMFYSITADMWCIGSIIVYYIQKLIKASRGGE